MTFECAASDWPDFLPVIIGLVWVAFAVGAWFFPNSPFMWRIIYERYPEERNATRLQLFFGYTREELGSFSLWSCRIIPMIGALIFGGFGLTILVLKFQQCGRLSLPIAHTLSVGVGFRYWPPMIAFVAAALIVAVAYLPKIQANRRILFFGLFLAWGFAGSEAAAFHIGPVANTWGLLAVLSFFGLAFGMWQWRAQKAGI